MKKTLKREQHQNDINIKMFRHTLNGTEQYTEIKPHIYVQLIFNNNVKVLQCGKIILFNTSC